MGGSVCRTNKEPSGLYATGFNIHDDLEHWIRLTQVHLADALRGRLGRHLANIAKVLIDAHNFAAAKNALSIQETIHAIVSGLDHATEGYLYQVPILELQIGECSQCLVYPLS